MSGWETAARELDVARTASQDFWRTYLADHPDVMHHLLADLYQATRGVDAPPATLDDLWGLVAPQFSNAPFGEAVKTLLAGRSVRWLAGELHLHHSFVLRVLNGQRDLVSLRDPQESMRRIEEIARVLKVHPSYFAEWRRLWLMFLLDQAFEAHPNLSIGVYKRFSGQAMNGR